MKIGITIPVLNNFHGLLDSINSMRSKYPLQFCIVDNKLVPKSVAEAWNQGIDFLFSQGCKYVLVVNDDVLFTSFTIDNLVAVMKEKKAGIVTGNNVQGEYKNPVQVLTMRSVPEEVYAPNPDFSCFLLSKRTWDTVGRFDENFKPAYFEDNDYHARIALAGLSAIRCSSAPYFHFGSVTANAMRRTEAEEKERAASFVRNRVYFKMKWGYLPVDTEVEMRERYYATPFNDVVLTIRDCPILT